MPDAGYAFGAKAWVLWEVNAAARLAACCYSASDAVASIGFLVLISIEMVAVSWLAVGYPLVSAAGQEDSADVERLFLADEAGAGEFQAVTSFPELLDRRTVQMKVFRSLASKDPEIFRAAVGLCLEAPRLESFAMIRRRLSLAFRSQDAWKRKAILQLARQVPGRLQDLRFVSLLSEALRHPDPALAELAFSLIRSRPGLRDLPAIVESLTQLPEEGPATDPTLPSLQFFGDRVLPLLQKSGADGKSCFDCHKSHVIFRLEPAQERAGPEDVQGYYRSALRVIDLKRPEQSLVLLKPTREPPPKGTRASGSDQHGGGVRWNRESASYRTILEWVQTGGD